MIEGDTITCANLHGGDDIYSLVHEQITEPGIPQREKNYLTLSGCLLETRVTVWKQFIPTRQNTEHELVKCCKCRIQQDAITLAHSL